MTEFKHELGTFLKFHGVMPQAIDKYREDNGKTIGIYGFTIEECGVAPDTHFEIETVAYDNSYCSCCQDIYEQDTILLAEILPYLETVWELDSFDRELKG